MFAFSTCREKGFPNGANTAGHDFDYIWQAFRSMVDFNAHTVRHTQLVLHPFPYKEGCDSLQSKFWQVLAKHVIASKDFFTLPGKRLVQRSVISRVKRFEVPPFNDLLAPVYYRLFRDHALRISGASDAPRGNPVPIIGVREKEKRHRFTNHRDIVDHIAKTCAFCQIKELPESLYQSTSAAEEVMLVNSLDVYITPAGGGSYSALFLNDGASALFGKICWPINDQAAPADPTSFRLEQMELNRSKATDVACFKSDSALWDRVAYISRAFATAATPAKLEFESETVAHTHEFHQTQNAFSFSYEMDLQQLDAFLNHALKHRFAV